MVVVVAPAAAAVFAGYADSHRTGLPAHPSPWKGDPNVVFVGCHSAFLQAPCPTDSSDADLYDARGPRLDNTTMTTMVVTDASVAVVHVRSIS